VHSVEEESGLQTSNTKTKTIPMSLSPIKNGLEPSQAFPITPT